MAFKPQALGLVRARIAQSLSAEQSPLQHASYLQLLIDAILLQPSIVGDVLTPLLTPYPSPPVPPYLLRMSPFGPSSRSLFGATPAHRAISNSLCIFDFPIHVQLIYGL